MLGDSFVSGRSKFFDHSLEIQEPTAKVYVKVRFADLPEDQLAQLDTGAAWSILPPDLAQAVGAERTGNRVRLTSRFGTHEGYLVRLPFTFIAEAGESLNTDGTFFVSQDWPSSVTFLGYSGLLDGIRFALDPRPTTSTSGRHRRAGNPDEMPKPARIAQKTEAPVSYVARIREHVEREEVGAARRILAEALRVGADEPGLANWEKLLAPGKVLGYSPPELGSDLQAEIRWLDEHGRAYKGQWIAVLGEKMLAHAETLEELRSKLSTLSLRARPLVHFME